MISKIMKSFNKFKSSNMIKPKLPNGSSGCSESSSKIKKVPNEFKDENEKLKKRVRELGKDLHDKVLEISTLRS